MLSWYVVYTHPREEKLAVENLERQGFSTYWPRFRKQVTHARKVHEAVASLFPRYMFVRFDKTVPGWRTIASTRGVVGLVKNGNEPIGVPERMIGDIRAREDGDGFVVLGRQLTLEKGCRIQIKNPAFAGCDVFFEEKRDSERVVALLKLLGREVAVQVPISSIAPVC